MVVAQHDGARLSAIWSVWKEAQVEAAHDARRPGERYDRDTVDVGECDVRERSVAANRHRARIGAAHVLVAVRRGIHRHGGRIASRRSIEDEERRRLERIEGRRCESRLRDRRFDRRIRREAAGGYRDAAPAGRHVEREIAGRYRASHRTRRHVDLRDVVAEVVRYVCSASAGSDRDTRWKRAPRRRGECDRIAFRLQRSARVEIEDPHRAARNVRCEHDRARRIGRVAHRRDPSEKRSRGIPIDAREAHRLRVDDGQRVAGSRPRRSARGRGRAGASASGVADDCKASVRRHRDPQWVRSNEDAAAFRRCDASVGKN